MYLKYTTYLVSLQLLVGIHVEVALHGGLGLASVLAQQTWLWKLRHFYVYLTLETSNLRDSDVFRTFRVCRGKSKYIFEKLI